MKRSRIIPGIFILIGVSLLLLSSCIGIQIETVLNEDGSGRMTIEFRISQALLQMGEEDTGVEIPLSKDDLSEEYSGIDGVTLVDVFEEDTEEYRLITAIIDFEDFNAISAGDEFISEEATLEEKGADTVLTFRIGQSTEDAAAVGAPEMDESMLAMAQAFMEGYELTYKIVTPKAVKQHSHGVLEADGRTVVFTIPMGDFIAIAEPYDLVVSW